MSKDFDKSRPTTGAAAGLTASGAAQDIAVALLTGGFDKPYVFGLATALLSKGVALDLIGSDQVDCPEFHNNPRLRFLNLRGSHSPDVSLFAKVLRVLRYYARLIMYAAAKGSPTIFHILWNNKFEFFDRTLLMVYYRLLGKRIVLTLHNVNTRSRDSRDTFLNRLTLRMQYRFADRIFVHTEKMKVELIGQFGVPAARVTVIPFGINNAVPNTSLTVGQAKRRLGIRDGERTILFFGHIATYKGLDYLVAAFHQIMARHDEYRLIIVGRPKETFESYWTSIREMIADDVRRGSVLLRAEFIPDDETEVFFKAADVLVLPYRQVYQSGVLFLAYSFGLPTLASDIGSLKDEIVEGETGFVCKPADPVALADVIERYFASDLYANLDSRRSKIREYATERHSWDVVGQVTTGVYTHLLQMASQPEMSNHEAQTSVEMKTQF